MAPSTHFNVVAIYEFMKYLGFLRVGVLYGYRSINSMMKESFLELVEADLQTGSYSWTILLTSQISNRADASSSVELLKKRDSRINFVALHLGCNRFSVFRRVWVNVSLELSNCSGMAAKSSTVQTSDSFVLRLRISRRGLSSTFCLLLSCLHWLSAEQSM